MDGGCLLGVRRTSLALVDRLLDSFQDVEESLGWARVFNGAMVPVQPAQDVPLTVKSGSLPDDLAGAYLRVGPNPAFWPPKKRTHAFDGDGMVHSVRIKDGAAVYHCAFLETPRYKIEQQYGGEWFTRIGEYYGLSGLAKILAVVPKKQRLAGLLDHETSTANTAIAITPEGRLWALNEGGRPFRFRLDGTGRPLSLGYDDLEGTLQESVSAHPKFDQRTGEMFFHGRKLGQKFYAGKGEKGRLTELCPLAMPDGFHHDMFITENYVVMVDGAMRFGPEGVVKKKPLWMFKREAKLRFGVFPRAAGKLTAEAFIWIEAPEAAEIVHTLYAYDEGGKIVLWTPLGFYKEGAEEGILGEIGPLQMHRVLIDVGAGTAEIQKVAGGELYNTEFPRIRDDRVGLRVRHGYSGLQSPGADFNFTGILKWDFEAQALAATIHFQPGVVGGEPVFVPSRSRSWFGGAGEDDCGYIAMFLWNPETEESTFVLFDAQSFSPTPVVELLVPRRVPLGFHAAWVAEEQFQQQLQLP